MGAHTYCSECRLNYGVVEYYNRVIVNIVHRVRQLTTVFENFTAKDLDMYYS